MGQYDIFVIGGIAVAAGYYLITNPSILQGIFPTTEPTPTEDPAGGGDGDGEISETDGDTKGDGGYDCAKACRNCWCKSYNEKCGGSGCSRCKGGNRIASKCGGQGVEPSKSTSSGSSGGSHSSTGGSSKAEICGDLCRRKECSTYKKTCSGSCKNCTGSSGCSSMCSSAQCGSYKAAGCSKSSCSNCSWAFEATRLVGNFPYTDDMRLTIA